MKNNNTNWLKNMIGKENMVYTIFWIVMFMFISIICGVIPSYNVISLVIILLLIRVTFKSYLMSKKYTYFWLSFIIDAIIGFILITLSTDFQIWNWV